MRGWHESAHPSASSQPSQSGNLAVGQSVAWPRPFVDCFSGHSPSASSSSGAHFAVPRKTHPSARLRFDACSGLFGQSRAEVGGPFPAWRSSPTVQDASLPLVDLTLRSSVPILDTAVWLWGTGYGLLRIVLYMRFSLALWALSLFLRCLAYYGGNA